MGINCGGLNAKGWFWLFSLAYSDCESIVLDSLSQFQPLLVIVGMGFPVSPFLEAVILVSNELLPCFETLLLYHALWITRSLYH